MSITIALLRRPGELVALNIVRRDPFRAPKHGATLCVDPYMEVAGPLADSDLSNLAEIADAWERLGHVSDFDRQTVEDIASILLVTTPDDTSPVAPLWHPPVEPKPTQPTAAHPRAFKGTKAQPPKPAALPTVDLRPYLCNARDTRAILQYLGDRIEADAQLAIEFMNYPAPFRKSFGLLPLFAPDIIKDVLGFYWGLELAGNDALRRCVSVAMRDLSSPGHLFWCDSIQRLEPERRAAAMELVCEHKMNGRCADSVDDLQALSALSNNAQFCNRVAAMLISLRNGLSIEGLFEGFKLANAYQPEFDFLDVAYDEAFTCEPLLQWGSDIGPDKEDGVWKRAATSLSLWRMCGELPGFAGWLETRCWEGFHPDVAYHLVDPFYECWYSDTPEITQRGFNALLQSSDRYVAAIRALPPDYRLKGIGLFSAAFWDSPSGVNHLIDRALQLLPMVCCEPFSQDVQRGAYPALIELDDARFAQLCQAPPESFRRMEAACARTNDATLIADGIESLIAAQPDFLLEAFTHCPGTLMRAMKTCGCLAEPVRRELVEQYRGHALFAIPSGNLRELAQYVELHLPAGVDNPLPAKVRQFARDAIRLTPGQLERAMRVVQDGLVRTRVSLLQHLAQKKLESSIGAAGLAPDDAVAHAAQLQNLAKENRRGLRKFLRAYFSGQSDYLQQHAGNQQWLNEHASIAPRWLAGMTMTRTISPHGELVFSVENDPLEALRLGTYTGSCLGIGGILSLSAAAVVLDINKAVVYARNGRGRVIARQMLAVCDKGCVVCFEVYPSSVSQEMKDGFAAFDSQFASHLGTDIHIENDDAAISRPVSRYWWDDGAWNPLAEEPDA